MDGPFNSPGVSETPSRRRIFVCRPERETARETKRAGAQREPTARGASRRTWRAPRLPPAGHRRRTSTSLMPYFDDRPQGRRLRRRHRAAGRGGARQPRVPVSRDPHASRQRPGPRRPNQLALTDLELASRLSFFLWSQGPDETLLDGRGGRKAARAGGAARAGAAHAEGPARVERWCATSRSSGSTSTTSNEVEPDPNLFPTFTDPLRPRHGHRDRVVRRQRAARGPQRRRPAHRRPHVPQRAAGEALRHHDGARSAVPARDAATTRAAAACSARARCCCGRRTATARRRCCAAPG